MIVTVQEDHPEIYKFAKTSVITSLGIFGPCKPYMFKFDVMICDITCQNKAFVAEISCCIIEKECDFSFI